MIPPFSAAAEHPLQANPATLQPLPSYVAMQASLSFAVARVRASTLVRPSLRGFSGTLVGLAVVLIFQAVRNHDTNLTISAVSKRWKRGLLSAINWKSLGSFIVAVLEELTWRVAALPHPSVDGASGIPTGVGSLTQVAFRIGINGVGFAMYKSLLAKYLAFVLAKETETVSIFSLNLDSALLGIACAVAYQISGGTIYAPLLLRYLLKATEPLKKCMGACGRGICRHRFSDEELWVEDSIATSMPPAAKLCIRVHTLDETDGSLSLAMPLDGNTNIHGTAFAGSLYSVAGLCAWYTLVCYLRTRHLHERYAVVMKSAKILYRRPVRSATVVARSTLPSFKLCDRFLTSLEAKGKSYLDVSGSIMQEGKVAVEYTAHLCAFRAQKQ